MLEKLFVTILGISSAVGLCIVILLALTPVMKRLFAAKWNYLIWLILALRLVIPLKLPLAEPALQVNIPSLTLGENVTVPSDTSPESLAPWSPILLETGAAAGNSIHNDAHSHLPSGQPSDLSFDGFNPDGFSPDRFGPDGFSADRSSPVRSGPVGFGSVGSSTAPVYEAPSLTSVLSWLWLGGAIVFILHQFIGYMAFKRKVVRWSRPVRSAAVSDQVQAVCAQMHIRRNIPVLISDNAPSPMMTGIFRPILLLPGEDYPTKDLQFILQHELVHFKRHDLYFKLLLLLANALHWFNPLVSLMARRANNDLELSCDDQVIKGRADEERRTYSEAILACVHAEQLKRAALTTYFNGGVKMMQTRFRNIFDTRRKHSGLLAVTAVLAGVLAFGSLLGFTTVEASVMTTVKNIELKAADCNVIVKPSDDGTFQYEYDDEIHKLTALQDGAAMYLTLESTGKPNTTGLDMAVLYVPDVSYDKITVDGSRAGISLPSLDADFDIKSESGAVSIQVSAGFNRSIDFTNTDGSGSIAINPLAGNYTFDMTSDSSAVSLPEEFPELSDQAGDGHYKYVKGNGRARINLTVKNSAFSVVLLKEKPLTTDDSLSAVIPVLDDTEQKFGPFEFKKGDTWKPEITWEGTDGGSVYIAVQPTSKGDTFHSGQFQTRPESGDPFSAMTIGSDGEYWIFVGNNGDSQISNVKVEVAFTK